MTAARWWAGLAVGCWLLALVIPGTHSGGRTFHLWDLSRSAGRRPPLGEATADSQAANRWLFAAGVVPARRRPSDWPTPDQSRLGEALRFLAGRLRPGDRVVVHSDGKSTDALPPVDAFPEVEWIWDRAPSPTRFGVIEAPLRWPSGTEWLEIRVQVVAPEPDPEGSSTGRLLPVQARPSGVLLAAEVEPLPGGLFRLRLQAPRAAETGLQLQLRYQEEGRELRRPLAIGPARNLAWWSPDPELRQALQAAGLSVSVAEAEAEPPQGAAIFAPAQAADADRYRSWLEQGRLVVLASPSMAAWAPMPEDLRPFQPRPDPGQALVVLLDRSGSMAGEPWIQARQAVLHWAQLWPQANPLVVLPFATAMEPALDPRKEADRTRLQALLPSGRTALAEALESLQGRLPDQARVVVLGDGRASPPEQGWAALVEALRQEGAEIGTVAVGEDPDLANLQAIGPAWDRGVQGNGEADRKADEDLENRLLQALAKPLAVKPGRAEAIPGLLWDLPALLPAFQARDRMAAATGAVALYQDLEGGHPVAVKWQARGVLVGLAAFPEPAWLEHLAALWPQLVESARWWRQGPQLWLQSAAGPPRIEDREGRPLALEASGPGLWLARGLDPAATYFWVHSDGGQKLRLPPPAAAEEQAEDGPWRRWLSRQRHRSASMAFSGPWLLAGMVALVISQGVRRLGKRGQIRLSKPM
ncbi:MAG: VWA domain-containing protein [Planctomycetota bacterium]|nr:MAG: VWA domain-containing protein [Planctomycetota bacterium]